MFRELKAIEIAEGALLADVAVIFQLLSIYLPIGGPVFHVLIFIVFTLLVLRRGLYVGVMGFCVSVFVVAVMTGLHGATAMFLGGIGGMFLGITMKVRMRHLPLLLIGITCGALTLYINFFASLLLVGLPFNSLVIELHRSYNVVIAFINALAGHLGLGIWWKQHIYPSVTSFSTLAFKYWWEMLYGVLWLFLCPCVCVIYAITNLFVRLLGYDVRPFPDGWLGGMLHRMTRRLLKLGLKSGVMKKIGVHA